VLYGYVAVAEWFIEEGVESHMNNGADLDRPTPLHAAASLANRPMVEMLLKKGPWKVDEHAELTGFTPLHSLAKGDSGTAEYLRRMHAEEIAKRKPRNSPQRPIYDAKGTAEALINAGAHWDIIGI